MWHSGKNPLRKVSRDSEEVRVPRSLAQRRLHKAFLRYHDANNWPLLREALRRMGRADLIGSGKRHLVPAWQPRGTGLPEGARRPGTGQGRVLTQHTGLPPRDDGSTAAPRRAGARKPPGGAGPTAARHPGKRAPKRGPGGRRR
jgi:hypothetical protein